MKQIIFRLAGIFLATTSLCSPVIANAETHPSKTKLSSKHAKPVAPAKSAAKEESEPEPDIQQSKNDEYKCELGNSLTMYTYANDEQHIAMRWKKHLYLMSKVDTTTGAHRFENRKAGFIWIGIPSKGLLLDSHKGQQLANECKTDQQILAEAERSATTSAQAK